MTTNTSEHMCLHALLDMMRRPDIFLARFSPTQENIVLSNTMLRYESTYIPTYDACSTMAGIEAFAKD